MSYLNNINDKDAFKNAVKAQLDQAAFSKISDMKTEFAKEFLKGGDK